MKQQVQVRDRVRENTPDEMNREFDEIFLNNLESYKNFTPIEITHRLEELKREWDIERYIEVNAASLALTGIIMGTFVNRKWFILSGLVAGFLLQHGIQGWCPPVPVLRALGVRTRQEIDEEIYALKVLRGDFDLVLSTSSPEEVLKTLRS
jgi:hypothetical protein